MSEEEKILKEISSFCRELVRETKMNQNFMKLLLEENKSMNKLLDKISNQLKEKGGSNDIQPKDKQ